MRETVFKEVLAAKFNGCDRRHRTSPTCPHLNSMSNRTLVSVIVIFLDAARFLQEAIESVLAQTHCEWELLLVDDGSSDGSTAIACRWAEEFPERVHYLEHSGHVNRGMSASRNLGISHARGEYIAFLDADDVWFSNILKEQVSILETHSDVAMVYGPIQWWHSWKDNAGKCDRIEELGVPSNTVIQAPQLVPLFLRDKAAVPSGILVRRSIIKRVGGFEDDFRGEYEDQVFCIKICLNFPVFASAHCWYRYRQHPDSCVLKGQRTAATHSARFCFLNWVHRYVSEQNIKDRPVSRAVYLELWRFRHPRAFHLLRRGDRLLKHAREQYGVLKWKTLLVSRKQL